MDSAPDSLTGDNSDNEIFVDTFLNTTVADDITDAQPAKCLQGGRTDAVGPSVRRRDHERLSLDGDEQATGALRRTTQNKCGVDTGELGSRGTNPGEFTGLHDVAVDSKGSLYTAEVTGQRFQKFTPKK